MKRLSVVLLLLGLAGCNYPSSEQARDACEDWRANGKTHKWMKTRSYIEKREIAKKQLIAEGLDVEKKWVDFDNLMLRDAIEEHNRLSAERIRTRSWSIQDKEEEEEFPRYCREEEKTNQYLGYENKEIRNGSWVKGKNEGEFEIVKHFRY
jgi:hypothetical protein